MVCQVFDDCQYHGEICMVEQVWEDEFGSFAMIRPISKEAICPGGTFIVQQEDVRPVPTQGGSK